MPAATYYAEDAVIRQVHREQVVALAGPRALLMMAAHPVAFEGFFMSTGDLDDPYARLRRTAEVLDAIAWGPKRRADLMCARVRAGHAQVSGTIPLAVGRFPAGTPYRADDPELLLWVLACLVDSSLLVYERYVRGLSLAEREQYWTDYKVMGRLFGLADDEMPRTYLDFAAYMERMLASGDLIVTDTARELGKAIVLNPPVPLAARPLVELANQITVGLLPADIRRQYKLRWDPLRALAVAGGAEYLKRVLVPLLPKQVRHVPSSRALAA
ncbi:MAG: hypothetical protein JWM31_1031 [Solirubrobacterales bacterium]|nr:hypothetical protein [Solirubrobacterales bacterium]